MVRRIFVNLSVADLPRSIRFFEELGFSFNSQFTNEQAAALVITDEINAMLHTGESFRRFTSKQIPDAASATEMILALQVDSREETEALLAKAIAAGGRQAREPEDHGFMYGISFEDLDGHIWEAFSIDHSQVPE